MLTPTSRPGNTPALRWSGHRPSIPPRGALVTSGRTLIIAVDGLDEQDLPHLAERASLRGGLFGGVSEGPSGAATRLQIPPGGSTESVPTLLSLVTGTSPARAGVTTQHPFSTGPATARSDWYADSLRVPTLFDQAREQGLVTAALQWPATAGADIDLCLPLIEDPHRYRNRWEMAEATSSPRMVAEHLTARREAGVQLSQVPPDDLVAEVAADCLRLGPVDLLALRLTGLGSVRRRAGMTGPDPSRALADTIDALDQVLTAFAPDDADRVVLVPGRPLVPTDLRVHPNAVLAERGLLRADGPRLQDVRALVWPDGPRGVLHVRRDAGEAVQESALAALTDLVDLAQWNDHTEHDADDPRDGHPRLSLRRVDGGAGATAETDVIAVLEGSPGTVLGLSATRRSLVDGGDPYDDGPRAATDPSARTVAVARGPGLPTSDVEGSWADLGVTLARAIGVELPAATTQGMRPI